jgi:pseudouridine-5'-phosphate glycosidase
MFSIDITDHVKSALEGGKPVVALESALFTHGFDYPANQDICFQMMDVIHENNAVPAVIGVYDGKPTIGLTRDQVADMAGDNNAYKASVRDLSLCSIRGGYGGTTVAATAILAHKAGIRVFATGGIGGIHRGHPEDVSADLPVLASTPIIVVCAGAKSILDLPRTLEYLETSGVPVIGWMTDELPSFYSRSSGLPVDISVEHADDVVEIYTQQRLLGLPQGILVTVPVPEEYAISFDVIEQMISLALDKAEKKGISGKALTPFLLSQMVTLSNSATRYANEALLLHNAEVASWIAQEEE